MNTRITSEKKTNTERGAERGHRQTDTDRQTDKTGVIPSEGGGDQGRAIVDEREIIFIGTQI